MERIHREIGPFHLGEAESLRSLFRSLLHHGLAKKRSAALSNSSPGS